MALPRAHQASFTPGEVEFIAGDEKITIIPKMKMPRMQFIKVTKTYDATQHSCTQYYI
jgi:GINS complex subunit 2